MDTLNENSESTDTELKTKRFIERSASYPGISLSDAVLFTTDVSKNFTGLQIINREDIAAVLKTSSATIQRDIAAAVQFGLFIKAKDGYQISPLFKTYTNWLTEKEKRKCLLDAFKSPKLYAELIEKFNGHAVPPELKTHLIRFHKIAEKAAPFAAEIFIESAKFAGALNDFNILNVSVESNDLNIEFTEIIPESKVSADSSESKQIVITEKKENTTQKQQLLLEEITNEEKEKVRLSGKRIGYLVFPRDINKTDINIFRKRLEEIELTIE